MKLATWNVNGIRARHAEVLDWIDRERPDVVCLQELKASPDQVPITLCTMEGYWCYWHGGKGYSGVGLHVSKAIAPDPPAFTHPPFDYETRIATVDVHTSAGDLTVGSIYVPNGGKDFKAKMAFLEAMDAFAASYQAIGQLPEERVLIERILSRGLIDLGRAQDPENDGLFTWWPPWRNMRQRNIGWRLDYVFATAALAARATECAVRTAVGSSDHAPVVATF